ncbi:Mitochondrial import inner membrane translocase subunit TIM50 [Raphanus sativus]|nr:Mitochondrial import inner membrane translocase subunit TIM50 [Raphanus sativus]
MASSSSIALRLLQLRSRNPSRLLSTEASCSNPSSSGQQQQSDFPRQNQLPERKGVRFLSNNLVYTLVLDLNETLLYTDWKRERGWRTFKRPGVDAFLEHLSKFYEILVYSDQMDMYVGPVCEKLDPNGYIRYKLARGATKYDNGKHYTDLSKLNRDPKRILYESRNAFNTSLQPENCVPIKPYKLESDDTALVDLIPFLEYVARNGPADIRPVLASYREERCCERVL